MSRMLSTISIAVFLMLSMFVVNENIRNYQANIASVPAPPFDGTVMPVQESLDWVNTPATEWDKTYSEVKKSYLVGMFAYLPDKLATPASDLKWGNEADNLVRNMKITYSVPYMGDYHLGNGEHTGSHLAVDIKAIKGTPVYAIANGVVVKAANQPYGFGNHVVVKHEKVPSVDDPNAKETYYSSYSHMDSFTVAEGDIVMKGEQIGYVGDTGTATTDHLHFQIDNSNAPWHPYWPFTSKEASDAGYDFTSAINNGFGKENALANTINPLLWVQAYDDGVKVVVEDEPEEDVVEKDDPVEKEEVIEKAVEENANPDAVNFKIDVPTNAMEGDDLVMTVNVFDGHEEAVSALGDIAYLTLSDDLADLERNSLTIREFDNGEANVMLRNVQPGKFTVTLRYRDLEVESELIKVKSLKSQAAGLMIEHDGVYVPDLGEKITVYAIDEIDEPLDDFIPDEPIEIEVIEGKADLMKKVVSASDFKNGKASVEFTFEGEDTVKLRASYDGKSVTSEELEPGLFSDVGLNHENAKAIAYLQKIGVVQGYEDGSFKPDQKISRVEVLKMILAALDYDVEKNVALDFSDVSSVAWYSPFLATAVDKGIVDGYPDKTFKPANNVNNAEFFKMLVLASGIEIDQEIAYKPYLDVDATDWYAAYAQFVQRKRLIDSARRYFRAGDQINRAQVAESIYRLLMINKYGVKAYRNEL